jgi:hypothetical protein
VIYVFVLFMLSLAYTETLIIWITDSMAAKTSGAVQVDKDDTMKQTPIARPSIGREGKPIQLLSNHFAVKLRGVNSVFYEYSVMNYYEIMYILACLCVVF